VGGLNFSNHKWSKWSNTAKLKYATVTLYHLPIIGRMRKKMPKAISVPPPLSTAEIPPEGTKVKIKDVRVATDVWTTIGTVTKALGLSVEYDKTLYSQLFSLDRPVLTGSIGRLLVSVGIEDTDAKDFATKVQALIGKTVKVVKRGGKLYWYP